MPCLVVLIAECCCPTWQHNQDAQLCSVLYLTVSLEAPHNASSMETLTHRAIIQPHCITTNLPTNILTASQQTYQQTPHTLVITNTETIFNFSPLPLTWMIGFLRCWLWNKYSENILIDCLGWRTFFIFILLWKLDWLRFSSSLINY